MGHLQPFICKCPSAPTTDKTELYKPAMHWEPSPRDTPCLYTARAIQKDHTQYVLQVCNLFSSGKRLNATSPSNKPESVFHAAGMVFWSFFMHLNAGPDLFSDEENLSLLNLAACTTLPGTAAALAPLTRAHIQHSREKCKSSYSAFAVQLGLKSLANSPNSAGYSSDRYTDA